MAPDRLAPVTGEHKGVFGEGAQIFLCPHRASPSVTHPAPSPGALASPGLQGAGSQPGHRRQPLVSAEQAVSCTGTGHSTVSGERKRPREAGTPHSARLAKQQGVPRSLPFGATSGQAPGASRAGGGSEMAPIPELSRGHLHQQAGPPQGPKGFSPDLPHESIAHPDPWDPATVRGGDTQS